MVFYRPPKSSIWAHSLRKMKPSIQLEKVNELKKILSYEIEKEFYSLVLYDNSNYAKKTAAIDFNSVCKLFESCVDGQKLEHASSCNMNHDQFQLSLEKLINFESMFSKITTDINLSHGLTLKGWNIDNAYVKTNAEISFVYGTSPRIGTEIFFNNRNEFDYLKNVLMILGICELNDKHLSKER